MADFAIKSEEKLFRRRVFYIPGFDPVPARRYRELYRRALAEQAAISGYEGRMGPQRSQGDFGWHVQITQDGQRSEADLVVLVWADIVKNSMAQGILATYVQLLRTAWAYIGSGALLRLMRLRKGPVIAALYPVVVLLGQLMVALAFGGVVGGFLARLGLLGAAAVPLGLLAGALACWALLNWFKRHDGKVMAHYLMHDYAFTARNRGRTPAELTARLGAFRAQVAAALASDVDEVLVVGHSSGAHLAVQLLADLIRAGELPEGGAKLAFLSLGQVVPMASFLPEASELRRDLNYLCQRDDITWVDVTAPGDGCAFALCDPVSVSGVAPETGQRWPLILSAAFTKTLSPERWRALRWRFFKLHFQYLNVFDRPGDYDYFLITGGAQTLAARYQDRAPSPGRITRPVNRYTSLS